MRPAASPDRRAFFPVAALLAVLAGCAPTGTPERPLLRPASFADLPGWRDDAPAGAAEALIRSCARRGSARPATAAGVAGFADPAWDAACAALAPAATADPAAARAYFERWFAPWRIEAGDGLFTGYYEPEVAGALAPDARHAVPLYRRPPGLVSADLGAFRDAWRGERIVGEVRDGRLHPAPARAAIEDGAYAGRGLELAWLADPVDAFFLQIQGSGRVRLPDGTVRRIGYDGGNGHPYTAIGRVLVDRGAMTLAEVTMQSIRAWLAARPAEASEVMRRNASFVFFRWLDDGPVGTAGTVLVPGRSLAVDPKFVPLGAPVWIDTADPVAGTPLRRLMVAQDTGGAIRGAVRGDIFFGAGAEAAEAAGRMRAPGAAYVLLPVGTVPTPVP